jgi:hypothetical protein
MNEDPLPGLNHFHFLREAYCLSRKQSFSTSVFPFQVHSEDSVIAFSDDTNDGNEKKPSRKRKSEQIQYHYIEDDDEDSIVDSKLIKLDTCDQTRGEDLPNINEQAESLMQTATNDIECDDNANNFGNQLVAIQVP